MVDAHRISDTERVPGANELHKRIGESLLGVGESSADAAEARLFDH